jgi:hypothetical protein
MSDQNDMLKLLYENNQRLKQTETREVPGNVPGFSQFYDFGTYVPTYVGGTTAGVTTYTTQSGAWVRVGALMVATGTVVWTAATGTGNARISLPLASANVANQNYSGSLRTVNVTFANGTPQIIVVNNSAFFEMQSPLTNAASTTVAVEAAGNIVFTVNYFIA